MSDAPPRPGGVHTLRDLLTRLHELKAWAGVSEREAHRRVRQDRTRRGVPEIPAFNTVHRCFHHDRRRIDPDLLSDIVRALTGDEAEVARWRRAHRMVRAGLPEPGVVFASNQVPTSDIRVVGRSAEFARARRMIDAAVRADGENASLVMILHGMAGAGKTTLARHLAEAVTQQGLFDEITLQAHLGGHDPARSPAEPELVQAEFLRLLGWSPERTGRADPSVFAGALRQRLQGHRSLLLLDDAASAAQLRPLLLGVPGTLTLVTSRAALRGLRGAHRITVSEMRAADAEALLLSGSELTPGRVDMADVRELVNIVGRLPLAVAVVAQHIRSRPDWTLADHRSRLAGLQRRLQIDPGIEDALQISYAGLSGETRSVFRALALHPGAEMEEYAAAALANIDLRAARRHLSTLVENGLLQRNAGRYRFHALVWTFARASAEDADPASEREAGLARLVDLYRYAAQTATDHTIGASLPYRPEPRRPVTPVPEFDGMNGALQWLDEERRTMISTALTLAAHGRPRFAADLCLLLPHYLRYGAHYRESGPLYQAALDVDDPMARAHVLASLVSSRSDLISGKENAGYVQLAIDAAQQINDPLLLARAHNAASTWWSEVGEHERALSHSRQAFAHVRDQGDESAILMLGANLADSLNKVQQHREAAEFLGDLTDVDDLDNVMMQGRILSMLAESHAGLGDTRTAIDMMTSALRVSRSCSDQELEMAALHDIGYYLRQLEGQAAAERSAHAHRLALDIATETGDVEGTTRAHAGLGRCAVLEGDLPTAHRHAAKARNLAEAAGLPDHQEVIELLDDLRAHVAS